MSDIRIIKRYQNRKLYDTHQSCYVTLEEIAQIIRDGHEIRVVDNKTKNDITYNTQIQILFDQEKKATGPEDSELLKQVVRSEEGTFTGYVRALRRLLGPEKLAHLKGGPAAAQFTDYSRATGERPSPAIN